MREYKVKRAYFDILDLLAESEKGLSTEAINQCGKELNTEKGWEYKGRVEALREVKDLLYQQSICFYRKH